MLVGLRFYLKIRQASREAVTLLPFKISIIPQELIKTTSKRKQHQDIHHHPFENIDDHFSKRDLQRSKIGINAEDMN